MIKKFAHHVLPNVIKPLRVLWNEIIAFIFVVLSVVMGFSLYRNFGDGKQPLPLIGGGLFVAMFVYFGVSSWLRAKKIGRS